jgi:predicted RNA-binding protein with RPS1 domain
VGGSFVPVTQAHPPGIQIFQLWQTYIDNINPLLKITHVPTVQVKVLQAASTLGKAPKNIEALMFGIYLMAITSMEEKQVVSMFNEPKQQLLSRYLSATQQALVNASFMLVDDPLVLQAFVLYLVCSNSSFANLVTAKMLTNYSLPFDGSLILAKCTAS